MKAALGQLRVIAQRLPVRWRLALGVGAIAVVVFALVDVAVYRRTEDHLVQVLDDSLREEAGEMVPLITTGRPVADLAPLVHDDDTSGVLLLQAFDRGRRLLGATPNGRGRELLAEGREDVTGEPGFVEVEGIGRVRLLAFDATIDGTGYTLVSAVSFAPTAEALADLQRRLLAWTLLGGLMAATLAYALTAAALRPVDRMRRRAQEIRASSPGVRLPLPVADDEVRRLGETLNHTLDELEASAERRRLFVAHASHELRTPLTRLRTNLELAGRPQRSPDELRVAIADAASDTEELIALADGLLDLTRLEAAPARPVPPPVDVSEVAREVAAATPGVTVTLPGPAWARIERDALRRSLGNIVTNAEVYGSSPIEIEVDTVPGRVGVVVWDHGPGMAETFEAAAFEPFTRSVAADDRPGSGMGLAIVATIAERNGGTCSIRREPPRFGIRIELPAAGGLGEEEGQDRSRKAVTGSANPLTSTRAAARRRRRRPRRRAGVGQQDLAGLGQGHEAGGQVHHRAVVVAVPVEHLAARAGRPGRRAASSAPGSPAARAWAMRSPSPGVVGDEHHLVADQLHHLAPVGQDQVAHVLVEGVHDRRASSLALTRPLRLVNSARSAKPTATEASVARLASSTAQARREVRARWRRCSGPNTAFDLRQHHAAESLVAVHDVEVGAARLEERHLEAEAQRRHLGLGDPVERAADDPQGLEHGGGAEQLPRRRRRSAGPGPRRARRPGSSSSPTATPTVSQTRRASCGSRPTSAAASAGVIRSIPRMLTSAARPDRSTSASIRASGTPWSRSRRRRSASWSSAMWRLKSRRPTDPPSALMARVWPTSGDLGGLVLGLHRVLGVEGGHGGLEDPGAAAGHLDRGHGLLHDAGGQGPEGLGGRPVPEGDGPALVAAGGHGGLQRDGAEQGHAGLVGQVLAARPRRTGGRSRRARRRRRSCSR